MPAKTIVVFRNRTGWNVRFTGNQARLLRETCGTDAAPLPFTPSATLDTVTAHLRVASPGATVVLEHA